MPENSVPRLRVIIPTFNGGERLRAVLEGYSQQRDWEGDWAITVIDNGSTDDSAKIVEAFRDQLPLTLIRESVAGKNRALNRAVEACGADAAIFVFTDDDVIPDERFVAEWMVLADRLPDYDLFGGRILPLFPAVVPDWLAALKRRHTILFGERDLAEGPIGALSVFGGNMAVRGPILRHHRFEEAIGPNASDANYPMGSETEFCLRIEREAGVSAYFLRGPVGRHIIRPGQLTREWTAARIARHAGGVARQRRLRDPQFKPPDLFAPLGPARTLVHRIRHAITGSPEAWWQCLWNQAYAKAARESVQIKERRTA